MTVGQPEPRRAALVRWVGVSLLLHLAFFTAIVYLAKHAPSISLKRGEPLFVELPGTEGPAPRGNPAERERAQVKPAAPARRGARAVPPAPARRETPPAAPAIKEMPAHEPRVVSLPKSEPAPAPPVPSMKERAAPVPRPEPGAARPEVPAPRPAPDKPAELPRPEPRLAKLDAAPPREHPSLAPAPPDTLRGEPRMARAEVPVPPATREAPSVGSAPDARVTSPPAPAAPAPQPPASAPSAGAQGAGPSGDRLAALRPRSPGGGLRDGRAGVEGEPIPLDTKDPKMQDYFERLRRAIKEKWSYPREAAEKNLGGQLVLEFGIAKDGQLRFVELRRSSGVAVLDDYAMNAVKLASPFPRIPDEMSRSGIPVLAVFNYIIEGSLYNILR